MAPGRERPRARLRRRGCAPGGRQRGRRALGHALERRGTATGVPGPPAAVRRVAGLVVGRPAIASGRWMVGAARVGLRPHARGPARHRAGPHAGRAWTGLAGRGRGAVGRVRGHRAPGASPCAGRCAIRGRGRGPRALDRGQRAGVGQPAPSGRAPTGPLGAGRPAGGSRRAGHAGLRERGINSGDGHTRDGAAGRTRLVVSGSGRRQGLAARAGAAQWRDGHGRRARRHRVRGLRTVGPLPPDGARAHGGAATGVRLGSPVPDHRGSGDAVVLRLPLRSAGRPDGTGGVGGPRGRARRVPRPAPHVTPPHAATGHHA